MIMPCAFFYLTGVLFLFQKQGVRPFVCRTPPNQLAAKTDDEAREHGKAHRRPLEVSKELAWGRRGVRAMAMV
jgi:hypothetical protein